MSKYAVISGPYFPVFSPNTGKYGPEITPYLDTFPAVYVLYIVLYFIMSYAVYTFLLSLKWNPSFLSSLWYLILNWFYKVNHC